MALIHSEGWPTHADATQSAQQCLDQDLLHGLSGWAGHFPVYVDILFLLSNCDTD
jgi:hypothetical protein